VKIFCFLFALYISALSVNPCYEDDCIDEVNIESNADHEEQEQEESDLCTPFCVSACCPIHVFCTSPFHTITGSQNSMILKSSYSLVFIAPVVVPIWQPPKVA